MSTSLFTNAPGAASRVKTTRPGSTLIISLDDTGNTAAARFIKTQIAARLKGAYQFMHAFDDAIYAYTFGDRIGEIRATGVAFFSLCEASEGSEGSAGADQGCGLDDVVDYYNRNKIAKRTTVVNIQLGNWFYRCLLTECNAEAIAGETHMGQFAFSFSVLSYDRRSAK
jgi:hypothetical protein